MFSMFNFHQVFLFLLWIAPSPARHLWHPTFIISHCSEVAAFQLLCLPAPVTSVLTDPVCLLDRHMHLKQCLTPGNPGFQGIFLQHHCICSSLFSVICHIYTHTWLFCPDKPVSSLFCMPEFLLSPLRIFCSLLLEYPFSLLVTAIV